ncbi:MAG: helix-turn-helix domain-containing protein [Alphaproteobacteria bacterium]
MSPEQSRAARGWLGWSQTELARRASVSLSTIRDFETGARTPIANNLAAMQRALESAGIQFVFSPNGEAAGIARGGADGSPPTSGTDDGA